MSRISRLEEGLQDDINYRARVPHRREAISKAALKNCTAKIARMGREVSRLQEALAGMLDHLSVIEATVNLLAEGVIRAPK